VIPAVGTVRKWVRRAVLGGSCCVAALLAVTAYGWWIDPRIIVIPLRQAAYMRLDVTSRHITVDGYQWPYLDAGPADGPVLLLLHGFGASKDAMMELSAPFAKRGWHTIAPDLPGFGAHPYHQGEHHDGAFYARSVDSFMTAMGIKHATMVGSSMGAAIACELAIEFPQRVDGLIMLAPAGVEAPVVNDFMRRVADGANPLDIASSEDFDRVMNLVFVRPPAVPAPFRRWFADMAIARRPQTLLIVEAIKPFLSDGLRGRMGAVGAPTLVVFGTADAVTDPSMLSVFASEMPQGRTALIPGAGHVVFGDDFAGTVRAMREFLEWAGLERGSVALHR
jgi:pimeloyl-ACP methyl ester carboxylesterase